MNLALKTMPHSKMTNLTLRLTTSDNSRLRGLHTKGGVEGLELDLRFDCTSHSPKIH